MVLRSDSRRRMWQSKIVSDFDQELDQEITVTCGRIRQGVVASNKCDGDKGRIGSYTKLCDCTLLFTILQVELRLNKDH